MRVYKIDPKPTIYKGLLFRSKLEAHWAKFFDVLKLKWEYEKDYYRIDYHTYYKPDFWVNGWIIEIKPTPPTAEEVYKARSLETKTAIISGLPSPNCQIWLYNKGELWDVSLSGLEQAYCFMRGLNMHQWLTLKKLSMITNKRDFNKAFERANRI